MYEVMAIRYGYVITSRAENFYRFKMYNEPDATMTTDYFFWVLRAGDEITLVDTGYNPAAAQAREGRICTTPPLDGLRMLGIEPEDVTRVIVSHFHYDHIGNVSAFPNARFIVQSREFSYWLGPHGRRPVMARTVEESEIAVLKSAADRGQVEILDGNAQVAKDLDVVLVGGHCPGQQIVVVGNKQPVALASDALHFYEEMERYMPFAVFVDLPETFATFDLLRQMETDGAVIVAGHDPRVMTRFPALDGLESLGVRVA